MKAILGAALVAAFVMPTAAALGDAPPSADVSMHVQLVSVKSFDDREGQTTFNGPPIDTVPLGNWVGLRYEITNPSSDPVTVNFNAPDPSPRPFFLGGPAFPVDTGEPCDWTARSYRCTLTIDADTTRDFFMMGWGSAPGEAVVTASITPTVFDPDLSNNTVTWTHQVACEVNGTDGDDVLVAHAGEAACGFGGDDKLIAEPNSLGLFGGDGNDVLDGSWYDGPANPMPIGDGGPGFDTVTFATAPNPVFMCSGNDSDYGQWVMGIGSADAPNIGGGEYTSVERVIGSRFNDWLVGTPQANEIDGGGGNDVIIGGAGKDTLNGGTGNDKFIGRDYTSDKINGGKGSDRASTDRTDHATSTETQRANPVQNPCIP